MTTPTAIPIIRRLVVGTDFSEPASHAVAWALRTARRHGAEIVLVHAIEALAPHAVTMRIQDQAEASLAVVEAHAAESGLPVERVFRDGAPWEVIADVARATAADLVVVGARGHGSGPLRFGRVADRVVRTSPVPVVAAHAHDSAETAAADLAIVGTDLSPESDHALRAAAAIVRASATPGRIVLVHAWQPVVEYGFGQGEVLWVGPVEDDTEAMRRALERCAEPIRAAGVEVTTELVQGFPARSLVEIARQRGADLVAVGTHGRSGIGRMLLGSVAEHVLHDAPCPVLAVRLPEA